MAMIAIGKSWSECEKQINESHYTGTTWEVYFDCSNVDNYDCLFFTDLDEARQYAQSISAHTMEDLFGKHAEDQLIRVEEDEWCDGESCELGFATWYGFWWHDGKWVEMDYDNESPWKNRWM